MSVQLTEQDEGKVLVIHLTGKLTKGDYEKFVPEVERLITKHGKIRILVEMHDFHGWSAGAMWADTKFAMSHFRGIERLAVVGEKKWQKGMTTFCKPFTTAEVRYYDHSEIEQAATWLHEQLAATTQ